jgi:hypothetical protein
MQRFRLMSLYVIFVTVALGCAIAVVTVLRAATVSR